MSGINHKKILNIEEERKKIFESKQMPLTGADYHHPDTTPRTLADQELITKLFGARLAPIVPAPVPEITDKEYLAAKDEISQIQAHFDRISGAKFYTFPMIADLTDPENIQRGKTTRIIDLDIADIRILPPEQVPTNPNKIIAMNLDNRFKEWLVHHGYPMDPRCVDKTWWFYSMIRHLFMVNMINQKNLDKLVKIDQKDRERLKEAADALNRLYFMLMSLIKNTPQIGKILGQDRDAKKTLEICEDILEKYWIPNHEGINGGKGLNKQSGVPVAEQPNQWGYDPIEARESVLQRQKDQQTLVEDLIAANVNARVTALQTQTPLSPEIQEDLRKAVKKLSLLKDKELPESEQSEVKEAKNDGS